MAMGAGTPFYNSIEANLSQKYPPKEVCINHTIEGGYAWVSLREK